jgi:hypothetical protein
VAGTTPSLRARGGPAPVKQGRSRHGLPVGVGRSGVPDVRRVRAARRSKICAPITSAICGRIRSTLTRGFCAVSPAGSDRLSDRPRNGTAVTFFQGGAVLDAVQGSALRSDPAAAGPADLDGVCAQLANLALTCRPGPRAGLLHTFVMTELDAGSAWRYSEITSLMPHGIPFTSPDVKRWSTGAPGHGRQHLSSHNKRSARRSHNVPR